MSKFTKEELKHIKKTIKGFRFLEKKQRIRESEEMDDMDREIISKIKIMEED